MHYLIQVNLYLMVFSGFYVFFLRKETFYQANRFYLMLSGIISFVIPFMHTSRVQSWFLTREVSDIIAGYDTTALEVPITAVAGTHMISLNHILLGLYVGGLLYFTWGFGMSIWRTVRFVSDFEDNEVQAFSFFGRIRVGKSLAGYKAVLDHERVHVVQCHSFDVILFEVVSILCWVNPLVYFLKREIRLLHEYQADEYASRLAGSKAYYAALLLSRRFGVTPESVLGNGFFKQSFLKARIQMLSKESSNKRALLKYGFVAPLFLGMMVLASASIARSENLEKIEQYSEDLVFANPAPGLVRDLKEVRIDLSGFRKDGTVKSVGDDEDISFGKREEAQTVRKKSPPPPPPIEVEITLKAPPPVEKTPKDEAIFVGVETQPNFPGGDQEMYRFLSANINYPAAATRANVQGRVVIQFVIEKDGSVSAPKVLKGIGFGTDQEAVRVVSSMPKWSPGMQNGTPVRVYYTIPIMFQLSE